MAFIKLNNSSLNLEVMVGIEESYKPNREIKKLIRDVNTLKDNTFKFLEENFGSKDVAEVNAQIEGDEEKKKTWAKYLDDIYAPRVLEFQENLKEINRKICPNYDEMFKS